MLSNLKKYRDFLFNLKLNKERKYIIIGGCILLFIGILYRIFPFFQGIFSAGEEIAFKEKKLLKYRQIVWQRNELEEALRSLNRTLARAESGFLSGDTPALCAVDIQNILNEIASRSKLEIKTMLVLKPKKKKEVKYLGIPVKVSISSTISQLKGALYRIESSPKILKVKDIKIRAGRIKDDRAEQIESIITVEGFMKEREPEQQKAREIRPQAMEKLLESIEEGSAEEEEKIKQLMEEMRLQENVKRKPDRQRPEGRRGRGRAAKE